jgi:ribose-phosphate pyrophosphokinase
MDLTAAAIEGFFDLPVEHLHATAVLAGALAAASAEPLAVVAPDIGAVKRAEAFQRLVAPGASLVVVIKERPRPDEVRAGAVVGEVRDRHAILVDDIISTGGTMVRAAEAILQRGALSVSACATHAVLAPGAREELERSPLQRVVVTDTIPAASGGKLEVVSVARLFAKAVARIHGTPVMERAVVME